MSRTSVTSIKRAQRSAAHPIHRPVSPDVAAHSQLLYRQATAGNQAVNRLVQRYGHRGVSSVRRAPAAATNQRNDFVDLLNGFSELATTAVNEGGRRLDTVHFGPDLAPAHQRLLESMRKALIQAQEASPQSRRAAIAAWPSLEARLHDALAQARKLGFSARTLLSLENNLAILSEQYIHVPRKGPSNVENPEDYKDFLEGIQQLLKIVELEFIDKDTAVVPLNIKQIDTTQRAALGAVKFGEHLTSKHRDVLTTLRTALIYARSTDATGSARTALTLWQSVQADLSYAFERAASFVNFTTGDVDTLRGRVNHIGKVLIQGGVYSAAHNEALKHTDLETPELVYEEEKVKESLEEFKMAEKLAEKATELTGKSVLNLALEQAGIKGDVGSAVWELVRNPHELHTLLEEFKKKGVIGKTATVADMADKILALRNAVVKLKCTVMKKEAALEVATEPGVIARWKTVAGWAEGKLDVLEKVEKTAGVITIVVSAIKIIDALHDGKYSEAVTEAFNTGAGYLTGVAIKGSTTAGGALGGAAMMGGIVVVVAAEVEAVHGAAALLRYCEKASVREAAGEFVSVCQAAWEAKELVADVTLLSDPSMADQRKVIEQKIASYSKDWHRHIKELNEQLEDTRVIRMGGQPKLRAALGMPAQIVLQTAEVPVSWQTMAEQIRIVFSGATDMAKWAVQNYPKHDKSEGGEGE